MRNHIQLPF